MQNLKTFVECKKNKDLHFIYFSNFGIPTRHALSMGEVTFHRLGHSLVSHSLAMTQENRRNIYSCLSLSASLVRKIGTVDLESNSDTGGE